MNRRRAQPSRQARSSGERRLRRGRLALRGMAVLGVLFLLVQGWYLAHIVAWRWVNPATTAFMEARLDELREHNPRAVLRQQWVDDARISPQL